MRLAQVKGQQEGTGWRRAEVGDGTAEGSLVMGDGGQPAVSHLMLLNACLCLLKVHNPEGFYVGDLTSAFKNVKGSMCHIFHKHDDTRWLWFYSACKKLMTQIGEMSFCLWMDRGRYESCFDLQLYVHLTCIYYRPLCLISKLNIFTVATKK